MTKESNDILQKYNSFLIDINHKKLILKLSLIIPILLFYVYTDLNVRQSVLASYTRILPILTSIAILIIRLTTKKYKKLEFTLYNILLILSSLMMYGKIIIHVQEPFLTNVVSGTILVLFLISLELKTKIVYTAIIYFAPLVVLIIYIIFINLSKEQFLSFTNLYPMVILGFFVNMIHNKLQFNNFKTTYYLEKEKAKTFNLYEEAQAANEELKQSNEEILAINNALESKQFVIRKQQRQLKIALKEQEQLNQQFFAKNIEIDQQKIEMSMISDEIKKKNNELEQTLEIVTVQQEKLQKINRDVADGINYAKTIQAQLLVRKEYISEIFNDYFLLFEPKETVGGDFYYIKEFGGFVIFAVADCTGHGVAGGLLTMLGITYLHEIVRKSESPGDVLNKLRAKIKDIFILSNNINQNGMDIALCAINKETHEMEYAGAYNPLVIIRNNEILEYKATRNPIGVYPKEIPFETKKIQLKNNDTIYLYSDGYHDQLGGEKIKKFSSKRFKELLLQIHTMPMLQQENMLKDVLKNWRGEFEQVDDITILGIKYTF